jgi:hypothetical protein
LFLLAKTGSVRASRGPGEVCVSRVSNMDARRCAGARRVRGRTARRAARTKSP